MTKTIQWVVGMLCSFALMITLLITSVEAVVYWTPGFFEKEYTKYRVADSIDMELDDLLAVTGEMMDYLRGDRQDLHVDTVVAGEAREFFNDREIAHMEDVRDLFLAAILIRRVCIGIMAAGVILLVLTKADIRRKLPRQICIGTVAFFGVLAVLAGIIATDFSKYFVIFHEIFFSNDLWILDPRTDLLINIVPEPFFVDTAARIGLTYGISVVAVFIICICLLRRKR